MSQSDFGTMDAAETSGIELAAILNAWRTALHSLHKGSNRPDYAVAGMLWIKDATDPWLLYIFDGAQDILIGSVNATTNVFTPSFGALTGILRADGSGGVAAATAAQIVAVIGSLAVANAAHADTANSATTAGSAGTAAAISDGAVSTAAKIAANIITLAKLARTGTAGKPLLSGGAGADFYVGDFPADSLTSGTPVNTTSGTAIDFTGIPSWAKRVTLLLNGFSTNGVSHYLVQVGSGAMQTTGYSSTGDNGGLAFSSSAGFGIVAGAAGYTISGALTISLLGDNTYISDHVFGRTDAPYANRGGGTVTLSGVLDRIRLTTVNGTDLFDAGSANILFE